MYTITYGVPVPWPIIGPGPNGAGCPGWGVGTISQFAKTIKKANNKAISLIFYKTIIPLPNIRKQKKKTEIQNILKHK